MKVKSWEYYQKLGYSYRFSQIAYRGYMSVHYCHEEPGENPKDHVVGSFNVYGEPTAEDRKRHLKICAGLAQEHMERNT